MLSRALIVLLIVLNAGVALWWATRPAIVLPQTQAQRDDAEVPSGIARLQLLREAPRRAVARAPALPPSMPASVPVAAPAQAPKPPTTPRCYAIGPFTNAGALATARAQLQPQAATVRTRESAVPATRGWRVVMLPLADRAAAQAMAERLKAAGIEDYFVMSSGDDANGIALGRYGGETTARQREAALRTAGFQAQAQPLGDAGTRTWLDIAVANAQFDPARARKAAGAEQAQPVDCATLR